MIWARIGVQLLVFRVSRLGGSWLQVLDSGSGAWETKAKKHMQCLLGKEVASTLASLKAEVEEQGVPQSCR